MRTKGFVLSGIFVLLITVTGCGCINNTSDKSQIITPTPLPAAENLHDKGFDAYLKGDYIMALNFYNQSLAADPKYTRGWVDKGNVLMRLNRTEDAIAAFNIALAQDDRLPQVWNSRGEALMTVGNYTMALKSFDKSLEIAPEYPQAIKNRNLTLQKLK
jgi:tetratricopeptide (TPR) repeat protein